MPDRSDARDEVAALLAVDALELDEHVDAEQRVGGFPADLAEAAASLAGTVATSPPERLRRETLRQAGERRRPGAAIGAPTPCSPIEAYRRAADDLRAVLVSLHDRDWDAPAHPDYGSVRSVVAHLVGIEQLSLGWVGTAPAPDPATTADHVDATRAAIDDLAATAPADVAARWYALVREVATAAEAADPYRSVLAHDLPTDVEGLLVLRCFELWAHAQDVSMAVGREAPVPDPPRLALMSTQLMAGLPFALALDGTTVPARTARVVLTGAAPGCYDVPLDPADVAGDPDLTIVADAVDICRVAARRLAPGELDAVVEGDDALARVVLDAVDAFARD